MPCLEPTRGPSRGPRRSRLPDVAPGPGWRRSPSSVWLPPHVDRKVVEASAYNLTVVGRPQRPAVAAFSYTTLPWLGRWDPTDSTSLAVNNDGSGGVPASSGATGYVADKSGNGKHLSQATSLSRPLRIVGGTPSGLDYLQHDGSNDWLATTSNISSVDTTYIMVARLNGTACALWGRTSGVEKFYKRGDASDWGYQVLGSGSIRGAPSATVTVTDTSPTFFPATTAWNVWTVRVRPNPSGGTQTVGIYRDGVLKASSTAAIGTNPLNFLFAVGATSSGGTDAGPLWWSECMIGDASITDAQIVLTEAALKPKHGTP